MVTWSTRSSSSSDIVFLPCFEATGGGFQSAKGQDEKAGDRWIQSKDKGIGDIWGRGGDQAGRVGNGVASVQE